MYLTLAFIGEFNDPDLVLEVMEQVKFEPFVLRLGSYIGNFGTPLWAGVEQAPQLKNTSRDFAIRFRKRRYHLMEEISSAYNIDEKCGKQAWIF